MKVETFNKDNYTSSDKDKEVSHKFKCNSPISLNWNK